VQYRPDTVLTDDQSESASYRTGSTMAMFFAGFAAGVVHALVVIEAYCCTCLMGKRLEILAARQRQTG
jgi:hypothetical protein